MKRLIICLLLIPLQINAQDTISGPLMQLFDHVEKNNLAAGSVSIIKGDDFLFERSFGHSNIPGIEDNSMSAIGSVTKLFTAVLIGRLIDKGELYFDETIEDYFPDLPKSDKITIRHLLEHTGGLGDFIIKEDSLCLWLTDPVPPGEIMKEINRQGSATEPGSQTRYSNSGYYLLMLIIENKYAKSYHQIVDEVIIKPLNMQNTTFATSANYPAYTLDTRQNWVKIKDLYLPNVKGVGDYLSTPSDMIRFMRALYAGYFVSNKYLEMMKPEENKRFGKGLMWFPFYEQTLYGHGGNTFATQSILVHNEEDNMTLAFNLYAMAINPEIILINILNLIYNKENELPDMRFISVTKTDDVNLDRYIGKYTSEVNPMEIEIYTSGENLMLGLDKHPPYYLIYESPGKYFNNMIGMKISFSGDGKFYLEQQGITIEYMRQ